jgi:hypothetical protein
MVVGSMTRIYSKSTLIATRSPPALTAVFDRSRRYVIARDPL